MVLVLLRHNAVLGVAGRFNEDNSLQSVGITCALCHSTVDNSLTAGIGHRPDGWANRDLNVGEIVALSPDLSPFSNLLGVDQDTVRTVLRSWGPGKFDAALSLDGKAFNPQQISNGVVTGTNVSGATVGTFEGSPARREPTTDRGIKNRLTFRDRRVTMEDGGGADNAKSKTGGNTMMKTQISILKSLAIAMTLAALLVATSGQAASQTEKSLYERLGGVFAIAAVVDHFSDAIVKNRIVGKNSKNPALRKWHTQNLGRLPGLKFMRTLWVCEVTGGPFKFSPTKPGKTHLGLEEAHRDLNISPAEFDEVAAELGRSLDFAKVPAREKGEVLAAFAAHKDEVTAGYKAK